MQIAILSQLWELFSRVAYRCYRGISSFDWRKKWYTRRINESTLCCGEILLMLDDDDQLCDVCVSGRAESSVVVSRRSAAYAAESLPDVSADCRQVPLCV